MQILKTLKSGEHVNVTYCDAQSDYLEYCNAIDMLKDEGYSLSTTYSGVPEGHTGMRHAETYHVLIYAK